MLLEREAAPWPRGSRAPIRILVVAGTRPEAIKLAPLKLEAAWRPEVALTLVGTGQHRAMFTEALAPFGVAADEMLTLVGPGQTIDEQAAAIHAAMPALVARHRPDLVVVQGDTTTAWAAALAAHEAGVPVAHVEAGLRSGDPNLPWPEERNRIEIDRIADLLFAPTGAAVANLQREGVPGRIHLTGNSGIDALLRLRDTATPRLRETGKRLIVATCHRRENQGEPLARIAAALRRLAARADVEILVPLHKNPAAGAAMAALLDGSTAIRLVPALGYTDMIAAIMDADLVLSDSGGLQEECPALGVPLLVLRDNSERPEAIACGNARLVGSDTDRIVAEASRLLDDPALHAAMARPAFPFGTGDAAKTMLDLIERFPLVRS